MKVRVVMFFSLSLWPVRSHHFNSLSAHAGIQAAHYEYFDSVAAILPRVPRREGKGGGGGGVECSAWGESNLNSIL